MSTTAVQANEQDQSKHRDTVSISYNGMNASFEYEPQQVAEAIRVRALDHYGIQGPARNEEFLFGPNDQTEIKGDATMGSQVEPGWQLFLHRRTQGGA